MRSRSRNPWWLIGGIFGVSLLGWFTNSFDPNGRLILLGFFSLIFSTTVVFGLFLLNNVRRSMLLGLGFTTFLLLRYLHLHHPLYLVLLLASLISLELYFQKR